MNEASTAAGADVLRLVGDTAALRRLTANRIRTEGTLDIINLRKFPAEGLRFVGVIRASIA